MAEMQQILLFTDAHPALCRKQAHFLSPFEKDTTFTHLDPTMQRATKTPATAKAVLLDPRPLPIIPALPPSSQGPGFILTDWLLLSASLLDLLRACFMLQLRSSHECPRLPTVRGVTPTPSFYINLLWMCVVWGEREFGR